MNRYQIVTWISPETVDLLPKNGGHKKQATVSGRLRRQYAHHATAVNTRLAAPGVRPPFRTGRAASAGTAGGRALGTDLTLCGSVP